MLLVVSCSITVHTQNRIRTEVLLRAGIWEKVVDASFMLDIYLNFRTGFIDSDPADFLVTDPRKVATRYIQGFFLVDFFSTVPW